MKTLEQLGISPTPWKIGGEDFDVVDANNEIVVEYQSLKSDIRLIAAAPDLYEALAAMLSCAEKESPFTRESGMSIAIDMARKAIKKSGGE